MTDFSGVAAFHRTQNGLRLLGDFKAKTKVTCVRCLEEFNLPIHTEFEEVFTFPNYPLSENEEVIPENGFLDLEETIDDFLMLEIPINPLCKSECKGLCRECGQDLNKAACAHSQSTESDQINPVAITNKQKYV